MSNALYWYMIEYEICNKYFCQLLEIYLLIWSYKNITKEKRTFTKDTTETALISSLNPSRLQLQWQHDLTSFNVDSSTDILNNGSPNNLYKYNVSILYAFKL